VPYALKAADAETLGGLPASAFALAGTSKRGLVTESSAGSGKPLQPAADATPDQTGSGTANYITIWTGTTTLGNSKLYQTPAGNVGLGTTTPTAKIEAITGTATGTGVLGYAATTAGTNFGVTGKTASSAGTGVLGSATATSGANYGVYGSSASPAGRGVYGINTDASGGNGVQGMSNATSGTANGVYGSTASTGNGSAGVSGYEGALTGQIYGVTGSTSSTSPAASGVNGYEGATTGVVYGVQGNTVSITQGAAGVFGSSQASTGGGIGVAGSANSTTNGAAGVSGYEGATTGVVYGVSGTTASATGVGVYGVASNTSVSTSAGVVGTSASAYGIGVQGVGSAFGIWGSAANGALNPAGIPPSGVYGDESSSTGQVYGIYGTAQSSGNGSAGVYGYEAATSGQVYGVTGFTNSSTPAASGVNGVNGATAGIVYGVQGSIVSTTQSAAGVFGFSQASTGGGVGVAGSSNSPDGPAIAATNNAGGIAGQFNGNVTISGDLAVNGAVSKGSGSFKIDHPLDPANKYLSHSFVESPDMMDVYNGMTRLDAKGEAWVSLPDYFEALNGDFRYQLTAIGAPAPRLYVAREVSQNRFKIAGGRPGGKVSWQVTGIRHDAYANAHRIPVTEGKPAAEQGTYLHPDVYGQDTGRVSAGSN
jgi:trimeric autotransporter adhesin